VKSFLSKNSFSHNVILLSGGTIIGQAVVFISTPLLTRLYAPEDFGLLAIFSALLFIITAISSLRYELAIPLSETEEGAVNILLLCTGLVVLISVLTGIGVLFLADSIGVWVNNQKISSYLWLLPIGVLLSGLYKVANFWAIRIKALKSVAKTKITQSIAMILIQLSAFKLGGSALIYGQIMGHSIGAGKLGALATRSNWDLIKQTKLHKVIKEAKLNYRFPLFLTWSTFFNTAGTQAPNLLFAALYSPSVAGLFFLANKIMATPMSLVGQAVSQSFLAEASEANRNNQLFTLAIGVSKKLVLLILVPSFLLLMFGEKFFSLLLGDEWAEVGVFAKILIPAVVAQFAISPISQLLAVKNKQHITLMINIMLFILKVVPLLVSTLIYNNIYISIGVYSISTMIGYLIFLLITLKNA